VFSIWLQPSRDRSSKRESVFDGGASALAILVPNQPAAPIPGEFGERPSIQMIRFVPHGDVRHRSECRKVSKQPRLRRLLKEGNPASSPAKSSGRCNVVARDGIEPPTPAFSGLRSTN
jgi:hypothetical protein